MDKELLNQISEIVKTFNFNVDSQTAKETIMEVTKQIIPLIKWYVIVDKIYTILLTILIIGGVFLCLKKCHQIVDRAYSKD